MIYGAQSSQSGLNYNTSIALDRDATRLLQLELLPPTLSSTEKITPWLLIHLIPVTASLSSVLSHLLEVVDEAQQLERKSSKPSASTSFRLDEKGENTNDELGASITSPTRVRQDEFIEVVRVSYLISEIHSYCLLVKCSTPLRAELLKSMLERRIAPGVNVPVEFVRETAVLQEGERGTDRKVDLLRTVLASANNGDERRVMSPSRSPMVGSADARSAPTPPPHVRECLTEEGCPICLVEPLVYPCLVTLCQHLFHLRCYARLPIDAADCPLCRFSLYELLIDVKCEVCKTFEDLWVCLICGFVGCGRGRKNHSLVHYEECQHSCSMQMSTNRIWNYKTHLFLNQELAILFGDEKSEPVSADPRDDNFDWTAWGGRNEEDDDPDVQRAKEESKEEAVLQFYLNVQKELAEEQRQWYQSLLRARVLQQRPPAQKTTKGNAGGNDSLEKKSDNQLDVDVKFESVEMVLLAEHHHRVFVVECYVKELQAIMSQATVEAYNVSKLYRQMEVKCEENNVLLSYNIDGLKSKLGRTTERLEKAEKRGRESEVEKKKLIAELQKKMEEIFENVGN